MLKLQFLSSFRPCGMSGHCAVLDVQGLLCNALNPHGRVVGIESTSFETHKTQLSSPSFLEG